MSGGVGFVGLRGTAMVAEQFQSDPVPRPAQWAAVRRRAQLGRQQLAGSLVGDLVHDLRNPLAVIQGFTQLLLEAPRDENDSSDLQRILDESFRMAGLLDCVIDFLRVEPEMPEEVSLERVLEVGLALGHQRAKQRRVGLTVHPTSSAATVSAHLGPLVQVLLSSLELVVDRAGPGGLVSVACRELGAGRVGLLIAEGLDDGGHRRARENSWPAGIQHTGLTLCRQLLAGYGGSWRTADQPLLIVLDLPGC